VEISVTNVVVVLVSSIYCQKWVKSELLQCKQYLSTVHNVFCYYG